MNRLASLGGRRGSRWGGWVLTSIACAALIHSSAIAGGYLAAPFAWSPPVTWNPDLGTLGTLTNTDADTLASVGISRWANASIPTCALTFTQGADLGVDHVAANYDTGAAPAGRYGVGGDGINPIIYDTDGTITDAELFAGASAFVVGFAGWTHSIGSTIVDGHAVMNGLFSGLPTLTYRGVFVHEFGHMLNLDHAQHNEYNLEPGNTLGGSQVGVPTMYPIAFGTGVDDLARDDIAWISNLNPSGTFATTTAAISGTVRNSAGTALTGINVVARSTVTPDSEVISCVSGNAGFATGEYLLPGLLPNHTYTIHYEQIQTGFTGGSRVGPLGVQLLSRTVGAPEFISESGTESAADEPLRSTTFTTGAAGSTLTGVDLRLNGSLPAPTPIVEVDTGATIATATPIPLLPHVPVTISGTVDNAEVGPLSVSGNDIEDLYVITSGSSAGISLYSIEFTPATGASPYGFFVIESPGLAITSGSTAVAAGSTFRIDQHFESARFGSGADLGEIYLAVASPNAGPNAYTIRLDARIGDTSYVAVNGTVNGLIDVGGPGSHTHRITGRGFSATPTVTTSDPNITVGTVTFVDSSNIDVQLNRTGGFTPGVTTLSVTNPAGAGLYAGSIASYPTAVPVELSVFTAQ